MQKESYYRIVRDKLQMSDKRFDEYRSESINLLLNINESLIFDDASFETTDEEKKILNKSVGKAESVLSIEEQEVLNNVWTRKQDESKKREDIDMAIENCRHKIQSVRYSFSLIENEIKNPVFSVYEELPINLAETEFINDVILFEFESFLMQVYSSLDVLIHLLKYFYPCLDEEREWLIGFKGKKGKAGRKTIDILRKDGGVKEKELADFFEAEANAWINNVHKLRNDVAHQSKVHGLQLFVINNKNNILHYPQLQDGTDVLDYCSKTQKSLIALFEKITQQFAC